MVWRVEDEAAKVKAEEARLAELADRDRSDLAQAVQRRTETEGALAAVRDPVDAPLVVDRRPPEESEEVLVESRVLRIDVKDQVPKVRLHELLLSRASHQPSSPSLTVAQVSTIVPPST